MGRLSKKLVSIVATVVVASTAIGQGTVVSAANNSQNQNIQVSEDSNVEESKSTNDVSVDDGVILHAWNWSFNNIKESMKEIADAGYTAVQTSPAQACRKGADWDNAKKEQSNDSPTWYYLYQPTYFTVGNDYLGSEDEFKAMCEEAHKYGIKIVVDVVANHLANVSENGEDHSNDVDQTLYSEAKKCSGMDDPNRINKWSNRFQVTQNCCIGMPDINTKNGKSAQNIIGNYLSDLVKDGADGFRFDAAKSIELPAEYEKTQGAVSSDFWPTVLEKAKEADSSKKLFVYGEVLQSDEPGTNAPGYINSNYMRITASNYSQILRYSVGYDVWQEEVGGKDVIRGEGTKAGKGEVREKKPTVSEDILSINPGDNWNWGQTIEGVDDSSKHYDLPEDKAVGFVETHDLYANAGATRAMSVDQREVCWAMLTAKKDMVPLFFNRPVDTNFGTNMYHPQGEAYKTMGEKGSDDFKTKNVAVMNRFHTAMQSESEKLEAINKSSVYKAIRGSKGLLLANVTENDQQIDTETTLPDGANVYSSKDGSNLTVKNGKITGTLKALSFVAVSTVDLSGSNNEDPVIKTPVVTVKDGDTELKTGKETKFDDSISVKVSLKDAESATYKLGNGKEKTLNDGDTIEITDSADLVITAKNGDKTTEFTQTFTKNDAPDVKVPVIEATLGGKNVKDKGTTTIESASKLKLSFTDAEEVSYQIDDQDPVEVDKDDFVDGLQIQLGKNLEAGKSQKVVVTAKNGDQEKTFTYTVTMKSEEVQAPVITAEYNGNDLTDKKVTFTDKAEITVNLENVDEASYKIDGGEAKTVENNGTIVIGEDAAPGDTIKVEVTAENDAGKITETYTFQKQDEQKPEEFTFTKATAEKTDVTIGDPIKITCQATGDNIKYEIFDNGYRISDAKVDGNVITFTPDELGAHNVTIKATCDGKTLSQKINNINVNEDNTDVKGDQTNKLIVSLTNEDNQTITLGDSITLKAENTSSNGTVKYKFQYFNNEKNEWYKINDYSEDNSLVWEPKTAGTYKVCVLAQDDVYNNDNKDDKYAASKTITITVKEKTQDNTDQNNNLGGDSNQEKPTGDATKTLPIIGGLFASIAILGKRSRKNN